MLSRTGRAARPLIFPHWPLRSVSKRQQSPIFFVSRPLSSSVSARPRKALRIVGGGRHSIWGAKWRRSEGERGIAFGRAAWLAGAAALALITHLACADEVGESFWTPGSFGSLAATPSRPGFSLTSTYYHTSTSAGSDVVRARLIRIGRLTGSADESVSAISISPEDLATITPTYTFATPVLGAQAAIAVTAVYGRKRTTDAY